MSGPVITDETCMVFRDRLVAGALRPRTIHRFVVGEDDRVQVLNREEAAAQLADPFATLLLLQGTFPSTAGDVLAGLDAATKPKDPLRKRSFFFLGEGSQVPVNAQTRGVDRNLRFLVTTGSGPLGPDLMISTFHPDSPDVELMAWDRKRGGFNYYRTAEGSDGWIFAGNSIHAVRRGTELKGPFETHTSGNFLMKELKAPWINWHSPDATIPASVLPKRDRDHPWFRNKEPGGALTCETEVARPSITRWTKRRFERVTDAAGVIDRPRRLMRQVVDSPTVNLVSSFAEGSGVGPGAAVDLPGTFFVDADVLGGVLGLRQPPFFSVKGGMYAKTLERFDVRWTDGGGFSRRGDTHFAFCVPERAFEDNEVVRHAIRIGLLGRRLAASLLMVDFGNPVFSPRRAALLAHVPPRATLKDGKSAFSRRFADAILKAAEATPEGSPEREFAKRWSAGAAWRKTFNQALGVYYKGVEATLSTQAGVDAVFRVAEARRDDVRRRTPLVESPLLFARTNITGKASARMRTDGTVETA
ncbi:MAG: hypothetical protein M3134_06270 [Actinomycetota bacterium]|nr:hypothetical protein [Actinomycetota bacterium]